MDDFRPSQVRLDVMPLVGTMRKAEVEYAAAMLVFACQQLGDRWQTVAVRELGRIIKEACEACRRPVACWASNPFVAPDIEKLWLDGFADLGGEIPNQTLALTAQGLDALRRYARAEGKADG